MWDASRKGGESKHEGAAYPNQVVPAELRFRAFSSVQIPTRKTLRVTALDKGLAQASGLRPLSK